MLIMIAALGLIAATPPRRSEMLTSLESLQMKLLMRDSATLTLDDWCRDRGLAPEGSKIIAERDRSVEKPATPAIRTALRVAANEPIGYRRVRLKCGELILSNADNWYVPGRLDPAMNVTLDTTDTSFGRVVRPLNFTRRTLSSRLLWTGRTPLPPALIENSGLLSLPDGRPISLVVETYTDQVLAVSANGRSRRPAAPPPR